jgi:hypothetical protein
LTGFGEEAVAAEGDWREKKERMEPAPLTAGGGGLPLAFEVEEEKDVEAVGL